MPLRPFKPKRRNRLPYTNPALASRLLAGLVGQPKTLWGVPLKYVPQANSVPAKWYIDHPNFRQGEYASAREAVIAYFSGTVRKHGHWELRRTSTHWHFGNATQSTMFLERPTRKELAAAIREFRRNDSTPSNARPDTLGWRTWVWDRKARCLMSPAQKTLWQTPECIAENWNEASVVRGTGGIHACRLPRGDWRLADRPSDMPNGICLGLVERFGKFVLGTMGWRAEWVIIKELLAPNENVARVLRKRYPEVVVHVAHPQHWIGKGVF